MTQPLNTWTAPGAAAGGSRAGDYHPECGEEHHHKPTKAIIGVGLLMVLSFVLYEFNGKQAQPHASTTEPVVQHQNLAANH
jgi:hypothetical protein